MTEIKLKLPVEGDPTPTPPTPTPPAEKITIDGKEFTINDKGEAIDDKGIVVKSKEEIEKIKNPAPTPIEPEAQIEIDGVVYTVDKDGNAVDDKGVLFMKKEDLDKLSNAESDTELDPVSVIQESFGYKPAENGQPIVYESTKEGLVKLTQDLISSQAEALAEAYIDRYFEENPDIKQMRAYKYRHNTLQGFQEQQDWSAIDIDALSDADIENVILYERKLKGDTEEQAKYYVEGLKKDNKLKEFAPQTFKYLSDKQKADFEYAKQQEKARKDQEAREVAEYWKGINSALEKKKVNVNGNDYVIPDTFRVKESDGKTVVKTIKDFQDYITKPIQFKVNDQTIILTQHQYDQQLELSKRTAENDIFDALRRFLKYDDEQLVRSQMRSEEIKNIKRLVSKSGSKTESSGGKLKLKLPV